jgi:hypothetical protein
MKIDVLKCELDGFLKREAIREKEKFGERSQLPLDPTRHENNARLGHWRNQIPKERYRHVRRNDIKDNDERRILAGPKEYE